ncbi:aldehyde dehydrogenase [Xylaria arbuscula]|nr:aldehyde dehydrogenase [Xylaria arbuscula]
MSVDVDYSLYPHRLHNTNPTLFPTPLKESIPVPFLREEMTINTASQDTTPLMFIAYQNVIDGELSSTLLKQHTVNPATLEVNPDVPVSTPDDVERAVAAAKNAAEDWAQIPWSERVKALAAFANALESYAVEFAHIQVQEMGVPVSWFRTYTLPDNVIEETPEGRVVERYTPIGVGVGIIPWNAPVALACFKIAPALLTGNTLILKPSPFAPYCVLKVAELGLRFFPRGVLQALSGNDQLGPWLTAHPGIGKVSFTGSCATGKKVMESCSAHLKRVTLELGGNDPAVVCEDVDPATVAQKIAAVALDRSGQFCMAIKRVYVHQSVYDDVLAEMVKYVGSLKLGNGLEEGTVIGPLANRPQYERVKDLLADIARTKLDVLPGDVSSTEGLHGFFIRPIVLNNPPEDARAVVEEAFGPIIPVMKWSEEAEVIRRANNTDYGLGASVWSRDLVQASRIADRLQAGNVFINSHGDLQPSTAFTGHKHSGIGSDLGVEGLKGWCNIQSVYTKPL